MIGFAGAEIVAGAVVVAVFVLSELLRARPKNPRGAELHHELYTSARDAEARALDAENPYRTQP